MISRRPFQISSPFTRIFFHDIATYKQRVGAVGVSPNRTRRDYQGLLFTC